ncbi:hypothetical protein WJX72_008798 [[Myrmecia] bisecta]|uniref:Fungal lipase-type domain-containing protein n=1 Tax=[Myrmecia] bisecta TaxID=41462 RepID=A0AAW1PZ08_9CHLO
MMRVFSGGYSGSMEDTNAEWAADQAFAKELPFRPDIPFRQQAFVMCSLSNAVYLDEQLVPGSKIPLKLPQLAGFSTGPQEISAMLRYSQLAATDAGISESGARVQFAVWDVEGLGVVVAFRGTASMYDVFADLSFMPKDLTTGAGLSLEHRHVQLHGGISSGANGVCQTVARECNNVDKACGKRMPVFLTGHSLGGGYA